MSPASEHYPAPAEVDAWCERVMRRAEAARLQVELLEDETWPFRLGVRHTGGVYLAAAAPALGRFYCFWQPCPSGRGPLLVHLPGYGSEMSAHPELVADGYNVLHVNPLGHATPQGPDESRRPDGEWPVLPETVRSLGQKGYVEWLTGASAAVLWALDREEVEAGRLGFFGTSQGGGTAMLLASTFRDRHVRAVAADLPFLVNFPLVQSMEERGAYELALQALEQIAREQPDRLPAAWKALGIVDVMSHAQRLTMPVLLTAGTEDAVCPAETVVSLFEGLPGTRSYTELAGQEHAYTMPFLHMARAWFRIHV